MLQVALHDDKAGQGSAIVRLCVHFSHPDLSDEGYSVSL